MGKATKRKKKEDDQPVHEADEEPSDGKERKKLFGLI